MRGRSRAGAATATVRELFHICYWVARTYAEGSPAAGGPRLRSGQAREDADDHREHRRADQEAARRPRRQGRGAEGRRGGAAGLRGRPRRRWRRRSPALRAEIAAVRKANEAPPDTHDYDEATTRDAFIDLLLHEAGWPLDQTRDREWPVTGMPNATGEGFVDYVLWGDDGKPLALVEAKRTKKDPRVGQQQAKLYADCLEAAFGRRPAIFYTNGYEHWFWDDAMYPPRAVQGFLKKDELELLHQRRRHPASRSTRWRSTRRSPSASTRRGRSAGSARAFERDHQRKALLVMATGSGKTRTVVALVDQLMRANWVQARAVPRRPGGAGEAGARRLQDASADARRAPTCSSGTTRGRTTTPARGCSSRPTRR